MSNIGLFYSVKSVGTPNTGPSLKVEVFFNIFKLRLSPWKYQRFCDIGILIKDVTDYLDSISVYLPFKVDNSDISDLGEILFDGEMLSTLFDHDYQVNNIPNNLSYAYADASDSKYPNFWIYQLKGNNLSVKELSKGTEVRITIASRPKGGFIQQKGDNSCNLYFRFRIRRIQEDSFGNVESVSNDWVQSAFSKVEMICLNFNKTRYIDKSDYEELSKENNYLAIDTCHLFFVGTTENEKVDGGNTHVKRRVLESAKWEEYFKGINLKSKSISYEWECKGDNNCEFFVTTVYSKFDFLRFAKYFIIIIVLGILSGWFSCLIPSPRDVVSRKAINEIKCEMELLKKDVNSVLTSDSSSVKSFHFKE